MPSVWVEPEGYIGEICQAGTPRARGDSIIHSHRVCGARGEHSPRGHFFRSSVFPAAVGLFCDARRYRS